MEYRTRKLIKPEDLNARNTLFGGRLLQWIDEEVAIFVMQKLHSKTIVTKFMSEINFVSSAKQGDVVEIGMSKELTSRAEDYSKWYNDLVVKADLADHSAVRGCMVIKPYGYAIWENMQKI
jgi:acyl-coenzyme A thioesterase PaaI-like protein